MCNLKAINFEVAVEVAKCVNSSSLNRTESKHPFWRKLIPTGRLGGEHWIPRRKTKSKSRELTGGTSFAESGPREGAQKDWNYVSFCSGAHHSEHDPESQESEISENKCITTR